MKKIGLMLVAMVLMTAAVMAGESKYNAAIGTTNCAVVFGPHSSQTKIKSVMTSCDSPLGALSIYARGGAGRLNVTSNSTASTTVIPVVNTSQSMSNGDTVVYCYANGSTPVYRTISAATTTNVTISSAITGPTTGDSIYEVTLQMKVIVADQTAGSGTNKLLALTDIFTSPSDSPLYITLAETATGNLAVTTD